MSEESSEKRVRLVVFQPGYGTAEWFRMQRKRVNKPRWWQLRRLVSFGRVEAGDPTCNCSVCEHDACYYRHCFHCIVWKLLAAGGILAVLIVAYVGGGWLASALSVFAVLSGISLRAHMGYLVRRDDLWSAARYARQRLMEKSPEELAIDLALERLCDIRTRVKDDFDAAGGAVNTSLQNLQRDVREIEDRISSLGLSDSDSHVLNETLGIAKKKEAELAVASDRLDKQNLVWEAFFERLETQVESVRSTSALVSRTLENCGQADEALKKAHEISGRIMNGIEGDLCRLQEDLSAATVGLVRVVAASDGGNIDQKLCLIEGMAEELSGIGLEQKESPLSNGF